MAIPASGPLALTTIQTEFGGTNPIGLNEYYAGGGLVPAGTSGTYGAVPSSGALSVQNFYGTSNFVPIYIEDVFSTWIYSGSNSSQTITNNIDLSTKGGLVWTKARTTTYGHFLTDTIRGGNKQLSSNNTGASITSSPAEVSSFNTTGYTLEGATVENVAGQNFVGWTFRKQPKFFDIVTYTGNGVTGRSIAHNLGSIPGAIIIKNTSSSTNWAFALATDLNNWSGTSKILCLNTTDQDSAGNTYVNGFINDATSTTFQVVGFSGNQLNVNQSGETYVAYLFASNAGGFGLTGSDNVITCGSFTGATTVNLGYEPQWVLVKSTTVAQDWFLIDTMRGWTTEGTYNFLQPNNNYAEAGGSNGPRPTSTGFYWPYAGNTYIYIAIRRGPMKVPTLGSSVYNAVSIANDNVAMDFGFPVDAFWETNQDGSVYNTSTATRLWGNSNMLRTSSYVLANGFFSSLFSNTDQNYYKGGLYGSGTVVSEYGFRRAPKFMDICAFRSANGSINHNLTVTPELVIYKSMDSNVEWFTLIFINGFGYLNSDAAWMATGTGSGLGPDWANATSTTISAASWGYGTNIRMVAYLFATCPGVSKVGIYTGTAALQTVDCGFTTGARFLLIRRIDTGATGDWYVYDSARGFTSSYSRLNSTAANVSGTSYVGTTSVGFTVTAAASATLNVDGGAYLFLAIA